jgi:hypothetical protein
MDEGSNFNALAMVSRTRSDPDLGECYTGEFLQMGD